MSKFIDIELPSADLIRTRSTDGCPDIQDCLAWDGAIASIMKQHSDDLLAGNVRIHEPEAVAATSIPTFRGFPGTGPGSVLNNVVFDPSCPSPNGGQPQGCPPPARICGATPLTFNSFSVAGYPFPGTAVNVLVTAPTAIVVLAGRTTWYYPQWLFFSARDALNAMAPMEGHMTAATIAGNSQLANTGTTQMAIGSDMFDHIGPLLIDNWAGFGNTNPNTLQLFFGNAQGIATGLTISGCFWGTASMSPIGVGS